MTKPSETKYSVPHALFKGKPASLSRREPGRRAGGEAARFPQAASLRRGAAAPSPPGGRPAPCSLVPGTPRPGVPSSLRSAWLQVSASTASACLHPPLAPRGASLMPFRGSARRASALRPLPSSLCFRVASAPWWFKSSSCAVTPDPAPHQAGSAFV